MAKGKFETDPIKEHHVTCARCAKMFVTHYRYQKSARKSARASGWRIRNGLWVCPEHAEQNMHWTGGGCPACEDDRLDGEPCPICESGLHPASQ